jgi:spore maturation protein CgeB
MPLGAAVQRLEELPFPEEYRYGVSFIGSLYNEKDRYGQLKASGALCGVALEHMESLISEQLKVPGMDVIEDGLTAEDISALKAADPDFYTNEDSVIDMDRYVAINNYLGNHLTSLDRIAVLNMLAEGLLEGSVHLFTRSDTSELDKKIVVHGGVNSMTEMPEVFRSSKINLNLTSRTIRCGLPQRIWDIAGCRSFCLTNAVPAMDGLLDAGREIATFSSYEELPDICMHYLEHDDEREEIAISGFNKVAASHTVLMRALEIVKMILAEKLH